MGLIRVAWQKYIKIQEADLPKFILEVYKNLFGVLQNGVIMIMTETLIYY